MSTILFRTFVIYLFVSTVFRLMGKRQVGDLELSDLVATFLLSELASLPIADHNIPLLNSLIPILIILFLEILLTFCKNKSVLLKRLIESSPSILIRRGELDQKELARTRISLEELMSECRLQGYGDLADIYYAILEQDGKLSVIPRAGKSPLCADDIQLPVTECGLAYSLIVDGEINDTHLALLGRDRAWLDKECRRRGILPADVFLMTMNDAESITLIPKEKKKK